MELIHVSVVIFIILNFADYFLTRYILAHGGKEVNPITRWFIEHNWFMQFKIAFTTVLVACVLLTNSKSGAVIIASMFVLVVAWNIWQVFKIMRET